MASQLGIGILLLPTNMVEHAGHDGWISVLIGGIIVLLAKAVIILLCKRFDGKSILDINRIILGKYLGFILNIILAVYLIFATLSNVALIAYGVGVWFFKSTPLWVIALYLMMPSIYLAYKGLKGICRFNFLIYLFIPLALSLSFFNMGSFRLTELLPVGSCGMNGVISSLPHASFAFMGFETLPFIFPYIKDKQNISRYAPIAAAVTALVYTIIVMTSIVVFGPDHLVKKYVAIIGLARMLKFPVLERVDLYYLAIWIPSTVLVINAFLFLANNSVKKIFNLKSSLIPLLIITLILIVFIFFNESSLVVNKIGEYSGYCSFFVGAVIPLILLLIALLSGKKGGKKA